MDTIDLTWFGIFERPILKDFYESELRESLLNGIKRDLLDLPSHSQAMKRAVKLTMEASQTVWFWSEASTHNSQSFESEI